MVLHIAHKITHINTLFAHVFAVADIGINRDQIILPIHLHTMPSVVEERKLHFWLADFLPKLRHALAHLSLGCVHGCDD